MVTSYVKISLTVSIPTIVTTNVTVCMTHNIETNVTIISVTADVSYKVAVSVTVSQ